MTPDPAIHLNDLSLPELFRVLVAGSTLERLLELARDEDLGDRGDVTSACVIDPGRHAVAHVSSRAAGVVAGIAAVPSVVDVFAGSGFDRVHVDVHVADGARVAAGARLATLEGSLLSILAMERTLLNLVGRASGIATTTATYADAVLGTAAVVCDTRKTTPGLRMLEKYAVRCGGGTMHRVGLDDAVLLKDNHLAGIPESQLGETLREAIERARAGGPLRFVEVEVDTLEQLDAVLGLGRLVDIVLLDNMTDEELREAVRRRGERNEHVKLEASGGVDLDRVLAVARTGVDRIAIGALTHGATSLDVGLDVEPTA